MPQRATMQEAALISRRPPAQKFASFEEYIQSHGGVTAPIEGDGEE